MGYRGPSVVGKCRLVDKVVISAERGLGKAENGVVIAERDRKIADNAAIFAERELFI
ncbi:hypothetical protein [Bacillus salacetis]|uniref:hypothetical protein n=1 Tax=Bacillus salacetis TaxID=2315464 RepID=UPI0014444C68|nr:hypothetical protein [Bacillus salacetis]